MKISLCIFVTAVFLSLTSFAQDADAPKPPVEDDLKAVHDELRAFHKNLVTAVVKRDVDKQVELAHENIVTTWQNSEVARGHKGMRDFYNRMAAESAGKNKVFLG